MDCKTSGVLNKSDAEYPVSRHLYTRYYKLIEGSVLHIPYCPAQPTETIMKQIWFISNLSMRKQVLFKSKKLVSQKLFNFFKTIMLYLSCLNVKLGSQRCLD